MHCASPVNTPLCKLWAGHIKVVKKHKAKTKPAKYVKSFKLPDKTVLVIKGVKKRIKVTPFSLARRATLVRPNRLGKHDKIRCGGANA